MIDYKIILEKSITSRRERDIAPFISIFRELYKLDILKDGLDLILTKCRNHNIEIEINISKMPKEIHGCCITQKKTIYNKIYDTVFAHHKHKILIQTLDHETIAHEFGHAFEHESGLNLHDDFALKIHKDLENLPNTNIELREFLNQTFIKGISSYDPQQHESERLARYFEMLVTANDMYSFGKRSIFSSKDVLKFFAHTTAWINAIFNANLKTKIAQDVADYTKSLVPKAGEEVEYAHKKWTHKTGGSIF
jgi:hypothetical protein